MVSAQNNISVKLKLVTFRTFCILSLITKCLKYYCLHDLKNKQTKKQNITCCSDSYKSPCEFDFHQWQIYDPSFLFIAAGEFSLATRVSR